jgi:hypothetical protein
MLGSSHNREGEVHLGLPPKPLLTSSYIVSDVGLQ